MCITARAGSVFLILRRTLSFGNLDQFEHRLLIEMVSELIAHTGIVRSVMKTRVRVRSFVRSFAVVIVFIHDDERKQHRKVQ